MDDTVTHPSEKTSVSLKETHSFNLPSGILGMDVNRQEDNVFLACMDGTVRKYHLPSKKDTILHQHDSYASGVRCLPHSDQLVSAGYDGKLNWIEPTDGQIIQQVKAHSFWSWDLSVSSQGHWVASVTGQYLPGSYDYRPASPEESTVKVYNGSGSQLRHSLNMMPPVQAVAISPDERYVAAANLMGETRVWTLKEGHLVAELKSDAFTSWGIIKSHHFIGGIQSLAFLPGTNDLLLGGSGEMRDPMAGNGAQIWEQYRWSDQPPRRTRIIDETIRGKGMMEVLSVSPDGNRFVFAGRLAQGQWNLGLFDSGTGELRHSLNTKFRVTEARFNTKGNRLYVAGAASQAKPKEGEWPDFGRLKIFDIT